MARIARIVALWIGVVIAICVIVTLACNLIVLNSTKGYRYDSVAAVPARPIALVLGAGLNPDGTPSGMLADRLDAAAALLRTGKARVLLFSGDNGTAAYNELASMKAYALAHGVPADHIVLDYAGFDTYDSCYRARQIFGVRSAIVVTQAFHLPRAIYLCRALGIDAVGVAEVDWGKYGNDLMTHQAEREVAARVKAVVDALLQPRPPLLGPPEPLAVDAARR